MSTGMFTRSNGPAVDAPPPTKRRKLPSSTTTRLASPATPIFPAAPIDPFCTSPLLQQIKEQLLPLLMINTEENLNLSVDTRLVEETMQDIVNEHRRAKNSRLAEILQVEKPQPPLSMDPAAARIMVPTLTQYGVDIDDALVQNGFLRDIYTLHKARNPGKAHPPIVCDLGNNKKTVFVKIPSAPDDWKNLQRQARATKWFETIIKVLTKEGRTQQDVISDLLIFIAKEEDYREAWKEALLELEKKRPKGDRRPPEEDECLAGEMRHVEGEDWPLGALTFLASRGLT